MSSTGPSVFVGELTADVLILPQPDEVQPQLKPDSDSAGGFKRLQLEPEEWSIVVSDAIAASRGRQILPGGSIANVSAAFANVRWARPGLVYFSALTQDVRAAARVPLWWPGYDVSHADLSARCMRVVGMASSLIRSPQVPGALSTIGRDGEVLDLSVRSYVPELTATPSGDTLVLRSDHIRAIPKEYLQQFSTVAILLADDGAGLDDIDEAVELVQAGWIFGHRGPLTSFLESCNSATRRRCICVGTDGHRPVWIVEKGEKHHEFPVHKADTVSSTLGAGDAYMGGFLAAAIANRPLQVSHEVGCEMARAVLSTIGARIPRNYDLNQLFTGIDRASSRRDEGHIFEEVRTSPGMTVVTGGQTGIDTYAIDACLQAGLPVHVILPAGLRQEKNKTFDADGRRVRVHELGSPSFRYRTWTSVYMADGVVLLDWAGGEGSAETIRAAQRLRRPIYHVLPDWQPGSMLSWIRNNELRTLLVAGSRESLLRSAQQNDLAQEVLNDVAQSLCLSNVEELQQQDRGRLATVQTVAVARTLLDSGVVSMAIDNMGATRVVPMTARGAASAIALGVVDAAVTWPSLLHTPDNVAELRSLGCYPVHYGFTSGVSSIERGMPVVVQYASALSQGVANVGALQILCEIDGGAEDWLAADLVEAAYDTRRTGMVATSYGIPYFFPTHWECASLIYGKRQVSDDHR